MSELWTGIIFLLNLYISLGNAYAAGLSWSEAKAIGGWVRVVVWCTAIMSACGFFWCELIFLMLGGALAGYLQPNDVESALRLGYVVVFFPILGSGTALWIHSVTNAWDRSNLSNVLTASYNTAAMVYDAHEAIHSFPDILSDLSDFYKEGGIKSKAERTLVLLVVLAICAGIITTIVVIRYAARRHANQMLANRKKVRVNRAPA